MKKILLLASAFVLSAVAALAQSATFTVTPSATTYSSTGGTLTFTVNISYTGTASALGLSIEAVPNNWTYGVTGGANIPAVAPEAGATGNFEFTYTTVPASPVNYTFTVNYPAGLTGNQTFATITGIFRPTGSSLQTPSLANIVIAPTPEAPTIIGQPAAATVVSGQNASFTVNATGFPAPTFQWQKGTANLSNGANAAGTVISGATTATLQLTGVHASDAGDYRVIVTNDGGTRTSNNAALTVNRAGQTITFGALPTKTFGDGTMALTGTASSNLAVSYASSNPSVATINGSTLTITGAGTTTITASQGGDADFAPATSVPQTLTVNKATATVVLGSLAQTYTGQPRLVTAATTPTGLAVSFTYNGGATAPINAGSYAVVGTIVDNNFQGSASDTLVVAKADQTIAFGALSAVPFNTAPFALTATASSNLPVSYASGTTSVATVSGSTVTIAGVGSTVITASQTGNENFNAATSVPQTLTVNKANQTITFAALADRTFGDAPFALTATSSSNLTISYSSSNTAVATVDGSGTVTIIGAGDTNITADQAGNDNFNAAPAVTRLLHVNKATATIALSNLNATYNAAPHPVTFSTTPTGLSVGLTYNGSTDAPTNAGSYAVVATVHEANYQGTANGTLVIAKANQTIAFGALDAKTFGDADFTVAATATSGLPVSFSASSGVVTVNGASGLVHINTAGTVTITANQAGDANYNAAPAAPQSLLVNKAAATVTIGSLAQTYTGAPRVATAVTNPSGLTVNFTYNASATAPTNAGSYAVVATINDVNYQGSATDTLVVAKADQTITFGALPSRSLDLGNFNLTGTASSGLPITYTTSNPSTGTVATVNGSTVTPVNTGTITITASQDGNGNYNAATAVPQLLTILNQSQTITFAQSELPTKTFGNSAFTISATSNRGLLVSFASSDTSSATIGTSTLSGGVSTATVTIVGATPAGTPVSITASQSGNSDTAAALDVVRTLTINKAAATVALGSLAQTYNGTPRVATATTTPTGLTVDFTYGSPASPTAPTNAGTYPVTGTINERNYQGSANGSLVVAKADQTIAFTLASPVLISASSVPLNGTATSSLAVAYSSSNTAVATVGDGALTIRGLGTTTVTATQAGDANYNAAVAVARTLVVNPVAPVVTLPSTTATAIIGSNFLFGPVGINALAQPVTFTMSGAPAGLTVNAANGNISGIPTTANTPNPYTITLTATNATSSDSKTLTLTLRPAAPVITSPAAASATAAAPFTYTASATPSSGITFSSDNLPGWLTLNPTSGVLTGTPPPAAAVVTVNITATNATASATLPLVITVSLPANAPVYLGVLNPSATAGAAFSFTPNFGTGATTYVLTGALPTGITQAGTFASTGTISGTATVTGTFPITIAATRAGITTSADLVLTVNPAPSAPIVVFPVGGNVRNLTVNTAITAPGIQLAANPATPVSTFAVSGGAFPDGVSMNTAGLITGTPTTPGTSTVQIRATNTNGTGQAATMVFTVNSHPNSPVITSSPIVSGRVGQSLTTYALTNTPNEGGTTYSMVGTLPTGLTFTGGTVGTVTGIPAAGTQGSYDVYFAGTNSNGIGVPLKVTFSIATPLTVPVITSNGSASAQVTQPFNYQILATNGPLTGYSLTGSLPAGLSFDSGTGRISGVPSSTSGSPATVTLSASNADGSSNPKTLVITVSAAPATPVITSATTVAGRVNTAFTYNASATESPTSYVAQNLPSGLTMPNPTNGVITGTPLVSGSFSVGLAAANAGGLGAVTTVTFNISPPVGAPSISSAASVSGQVNVAFTYQIVASGSPSSYAVIGRLPDGLTLNSSSGAITGNPTAAGPTTVSLTATGEGGTSLPQSLTITIAPAAGVPVITSPNTATATVETDFSYTITATNISGSAPYAAPVSLDAMFLPDGLAVNPNTGVIQGRPRAVGSKTASLYATNAAGVGPARDLVITVQPPANAPVVNSAVSASAQVRVPFSYQILASNPPIASYEVTGAPVWMVVDNTSGLITGTPPNPPGNVTVSLRATNAAGTSNARTLNITIAPAENTPVVTSLRIASGTISTPFAGYTIQASVPTGAPPVTSYIALGLPDGLVLNPATGAITGTPLASGPFNVALQGVNSNGPGAVAILRLTIASNLVIGSGN